MKLLFQIFLLASVSLLFACSTKDDRENPDINSSPELTVNTQSISFSQDGGNESIHITSNADWTIKSNAYWCTPSVQNASSDASVTVTARPSYIEKERTATITVSTPNLSDILINVTQEAYQPDSSEVSYIDPDNTGMSSDALILASKITLGWNLVNTLEAIGGETAWGNPKTTNELIVAVKEAGFNAIRIPCSWDQYLEDQVDYRIKKSWVERVKQVVDYCVNNDLYVILNIHWDGGWMENNCTPEKQVEVNNKLAIIWKQIAIYFRAYDEHLLFAGANEPNAENQQQVNVLKVYTQTFVDVVRSTGGRNAYRNLVIQAPYTDIEKANSYLTMPTDQVQNRLFAEVHYYTPWQFCGLDADADWGKMFYFWGTPFHLQGAEERYPNYDCEENFAKMQFLKMKTKLVNVGIPVILGEFGVIQRNLLPNTEWQQKHNESRAYFYETIAREAKNKGLIPFCWDNGIFNRNTNTVSDSLSYNGLLKGAEDGTYPF